jgi:hypothetical protein
MICEKLISHHEEHEEHEETKKIIHLFIFVFFVLFVVILKNGCQKTFSQLAKMKSLSIFEVSRSQWG